MVVAKNKYGYDRSTDPDYWVKTSRAIWRDSKLSSNQKMRAQVLLVQQYQQEKRNSKGTKKVRKKTLQNQPASSDYQNIKNKLGLSQRTPRGRVIAELRRLSKKSKATWKALKLDKEKTLKKYGIT